MRAYYVLVTLVCNSALIYCTNYVWFGHHESTRFTVSDIFYYVILYAIKPANSPTPCWHIFRMLFRWSVASEAGLDSGAWRSRSACAFLLGTSIGLRILFRASLICLFVIFPNPWFACPRLGKMFLDEHLDLHCTVFDIYLCNTVIILMSLSSFVMFIWCWHLN